MKNSTVYSGKDIARAGAVLVKQNIAETDPDAFGSAMAALSYWRACHEEPLNLAVDLLGQCTHKHQKRAVIAKRLKRSPSIINKLRRFEGMSLRTMQDIGGCRAIVSNEKRVRKVVRELTKQKEFRIKDYITKPKQDGYRSIHLIGTFAKSKGATRSIELQVRTEAQHAWATAVEIIDLFTGQAIKASQGTKEWSTFFRCAGEQIALIEDVHLFNQASQETLIEAIVRKYKDKSVPEKHKLITESAATLYSLGKKLGILEDFNARAFSLKAVDDHYTKVAVKGYFLLEINLKSHEITSQHFPEPNFREAAESYLTAEKRAAVTEGIVVALVSTDALGGITEAYPNYFADSSLFTKYIAASIEAYQRYMPNAFYRIYRRLFGIER